MQPNSDGLEIIILFGWLIDITIANVFSAAPEHDEYNLLKFERQSPPSLESIKSPLLVAKSQGKSKLPAKIGAIIGAYFISVFLVCTTIYILARKVRNRIQVPSGALDMEMRGSQYLENGNSNRPRSISLLKMKKKSKIKVGKQISSPYVFYPPSDVLSVKDTTSSKFDEGVIRPNQEILSQHLNNVYAHVMAHEEAKATGSGFTVHSLLTKETTPINTTRRDLGHQSQKEGGTGYTKKLKSKFPTRAAAYISSLFVQFRPRKTETKSLNNLKISSPILQSPYELNQVPIAPRTKIEGSNQNSFELSSKRDLKLEANYYAPTPCFNFENTSISGSKQIETEPFHRSLPLRQFDSDPQSSFMAPTTKTTILERKIINFEPETGGTGVPWSAGPVPYSPYEPSSMIMQVTPRLVTKEERKRRKKLEPKTPVLEMVKCDDELWENPYHLNQI